MAAAGALSAPSPRHPDGAFDDATPNACRTSRAEPSLPPRFAFLGLTSDAVQHCVMLSRHRLAPSARDGAGHHRQGTVRRRDRRRPGEARGGQRAVEVLMRTGLRVERETRLELATSSLEGWSSGVSYVPQGLPRRHAFWRLTSQRLHAPTWRTQARAAQGCRSRAARA